MDLESVSLFNEYGIKTILEDKNRYKKTPFLFLMASLSRNEAIKWANERFVYKNKNKKGAWTVYEFVNL